MVSWARQPSIQINKVLLNVLSHCSILRGSLTVRWQWTLIWNLNWRLISQCVQFEQNLLVLASEPESHFLILVVGHSGDFSVHIPKTSSQRGSSFPTDSCCKSPAEYGAVRRTAHNGVMVAVIVLAATHFDGAAVCRQRIPPSIDDAIWAPLSISRAFDD